MKLIYRELKTRKGSALAPDESGFQSQRDCGLQPKVARHELPWVRGAFGKSTPKRVAAVDVRDINWPQLRWSWGYWGRLTHGSSCVATMGFEPESRWDSKNSSIENSEEPVFYAFTKNFARFEPSIPCAWIHTTKWREATVCAARNGFSTFVIWLYILLLLFAFSLTLRAQDSVTTLSGQSQLIGAVNGTGTNALFDDPAGVAVDASGNIYIADSANNAIRLLATNGVVRTFAGQLGVTGAQDGTGTNAQFDAPSGLAFDLSGNLLVTDTGNGTIRKISPAGAVTTVAGQAGQTGFLDGAEGTALFSSPLGIAVANNGGIYVADSGNHVIRLVTAGNVSTLAGDPTFWGSADGQGTNAQFNAPCDLVFDTHSNLFVSDANNHTIRKITPIGLVTTFAGAAGLDGSADGSTTNARFCHPAEIAFDRWGNLLVADSFNETLREISTNGVVSTISGLTGVSGSADGVNGQGRFFNPYGLAFEADGALLVVDTYNELIREVLVPFQQTLQLSDNPPIVTLTWPAVVGRTYQVQYTGNVGGAWTNLAGLVTAAGPVLTQTDTFNRTQPARQYRVLLCP